MDLVVADSILLHQLHSQGIAKEFCSTDHKFHVADLAWRELASDVQSALTPGIQVEHLEPPQMRRMTEIFRAEPSLCVGEAASIVLAETSRRAILIGSLGLQIPPAFEWGVFDLKWVANHLSPLIGLDRVEGFLKSLARR